MRGVPLDRMEVHQKIWAARDRRGRVKIYQKQFAEHLGISIYHMSRIIKEFEEQGRLKKIAARYRNVGVYVVSDPVAFGNGLSGPDERR